MSALAGYLTGIHFIACLEALGVKLVPQIEDVEIDKGLESGE